jgi:hypothetical protein
MVTEITLQLIFAHNATDAPQIFGVKTVMGDSFFVVSVPELAMNIILCIEWR